MSERGGSSAATLVLEERCELCYGHGTSLALPHMVAGVSRPCPVCDGRGSIEQRYVDDGHRVSVVIDHDMVLLRLECPSAGCQARLICPECEGDGRVWGGDRGSCTMCGGKGRLAQTAGCWLADWFGNEPMPELHVGGKVELGSAPARIVWRSKGEDGPRWRLHPDDAREAAR